MHSLRECTPCSNYFYRKTPQLMYPSYFLQCHAEGEAVISSQKSASVSKKRDGDHMEEFQDVWSICFFSFQFPNIQISLPRFHFLCISISFGWNGSPFCRYSLLLMEANRMSPRPQHIVSLSNTKDSIKCSVIMTRLNSLSISEIKFYTIIDQINRIIASHVDRMKSQIHKNLIHR